MGIQKYARIIVYYNGHMNGGRDSAFCGKSIAIKIPNHLTIEENSDNLHDLCYYYLKSKIPNNAIEYSLTWKDILEWDFNVIEEDNLNDSSYDAELIESDFFYQSQIFNI